MWRVASDISPNPSKLLHNAGCGSNLPQLAAHWSSGGGDPGSGHWNDLDMGNLPHREFHPSEHVHVTESRCTHECAAVVIVAGRAPHPAQDS